MGRFTTAILDAVGHAEPTGMPEADVEAA